MPVLDQEKISRFRELKKQLEVLIAELRHRAILEGFDISSDEFKNLVDIVTDKFFAEQGVTKQEYEEVVGEVEKDSTGSLADMLKAIKAPELPHIPTSEEIQQLAMQVLPAPQIIQNHNIVKEIVKEKPITQVIETREVIKEIDRGALENLQKDILSLQTAFTDFYTKLDNNEEKEENLRELESLRDEVARLTKIVNAYPGAGGFLGVRLDGEGTLQSYVEFKAGSNITLTRDGKVVTIASTGGGAGVSVETPTGTVNGSNTTFTPSGEPAYVVADGITYFDGDGYTWGGTDIVMDVPPSQYIRAAI